MQKKIELIVVGCVFLIIFIVSAILLSINKVETTITLDINPSIEIGLNKNNKVISVSALNTYAKKVVEKKDDLVETIKAICNNVIEKGFVTDENVSVLVYADGKVKADDVSNYVREAFNAKKINADITIIEKVTEEDKELAKKYKITVAKAAYINSINAEGLNPETFVNKPVNEIKETKERGKYCDKGYTLDGDFCLRETRRVKATSGEACPKEYTEYKGICYEGTSIQDTGRFYCEGNFTLEGQECVFRETVSATTEYKCDKGELVKKGDLYTIGIGDAEKMVCVDKSTGKAPTLRCLLNSGHIMINGQCYNGPAPTINGGCPNGDTLRNGYCYSKDDGTQYECPDGHIYGKIDYCPDTFTYYNPTITGYKCNEGYTLEGTSCKREDRTPAREERVCPTGYTKTDDDRCINEIRTADKVSGYICTDENTRVVGNECVYYQIVEAKELGE